MCARKGSRSKTVLAPLLLAILLAIWAGTVALFAKNTASGYLHNLNIVKPALSNAEPLLGYAPPRTTRRVILFIVDGLRLQDSFGRPAFNQLRKLGVDSIANSHYPSISRPNHTTLITGVPPILSGVRNNKFRGIVTIDSLMDRLRVRGRQATYVADVSTSLAYLFPNDFAALYIGNWPGGFRKSTRLSLSQAANDLLVLIPGSVDTAGHEYGGDTQEYRQAVDFVDEQLDDVLHHIDLSQDTIIVTADHGHTDQGGHGGDEPEVMRVPLIFAGAGIFPDALLGQADLIDIAPTIAALLGIPSPGHAVGRTLVDVLALPTTAKTRLEQSDVERMRRNSAIHRSSVDTARQVNQKAQWQRFALLAGLFAIALVLLFVARRVGALHIDARVLMIAVPAYPLCYYGLLDVLGQSLSFSTIKDQGSEMSNLIQFGLISTGVQLLAGWVALQNRVVLRDRLAAANALVSCGLLVAWLPAGILWASHGPPPHVEIPGPTIALLIPANYIAVSTYAVGVMLLLVFEIVIFFARAIDPRLRLRRLRNSANHEQGQRA